LFPTRNIKNDTSYIYPQNPLSTTTGAIADNGTMRHHASAVKIKILHLTSKAVGDSFLNMSLLENLLA
jgi:hypothetical protein